MMLPPSPAKIKHFFHHLRSPMLKSRAGFFSRSHRSKQRAFYPFILLTSKCSPNSPPRAVTSIDFFPTTKAPIQWLRKKLFYSTLQTLSELPAMGFLQRCFFQPPKIPCEMCQLDFSLQPPHLPYGKLLSVFLIKLLPPWWGEQKRREGFRSRGLGCLYRRFLGDYVTSEVKRSHGLVAFAVSSRSVWEGARELLLSWGGSLWENSKVTKCYGRWGGYGGVEWVMPARGGSDGKSLAWAILDKNSEGDDGLRHHQWLIEPERKFSEQAPNRFSMQCPRLLYRCIRRGQLFSKIALPSYQ